jgi:hypothetical protein
MNQKRVAQELMKLAKSIVSMNISFTNLKDKKSLSRKQIDSLEKVLRRKSEAATGVIVWNVELYQGEIRVVGILMMDAIELGQYEVALDGDNAKLIGYQSFIKLNRDGRPSDLYD